MLVTTCTRINPPAHFLGAGFALHPAMKLIAFRAIKDSNGYVRSAFVGNAATESKSSSVWGLVITSGLLLLTVSAVAFLYLTK